MALHDVDKGGATRGNPNPNTHDSMGNAPRMAHGTTSVNYVTDASDQALIAGIHAGFFTIVQTDTVMVPATSVDGENGGSDVSSVEVSYNPALDNPIVLSYLIPPFPLSHDVAARFSTNILDISIIDDNTIGSVSWTNIANVLTTPVSTTDYTQADLTSIMSDTIQDTAVSIVKSDGTIGAENKATFTNMQDFPATGVVTVTYGGATDLWSETWTPDDINNSNFGIVVSFTGVGSGTVSDYIRVTNWGFGVPENATIEGIQLEFVPQALVSGDTSASVTDLDLRVYFSVPVSAAQWDNTTLPLDISDLAHLVPYGRLVTYTSADNGVLTFSAQAIYGASLTGVDTIDGPWLVKYYILKESAGTS